MHHQGQVQDFGVESLFGGKQGGSSQETLTEVKTDIRYAIGYEKNRNYKILRIFGEYYTNGDLGSINEDLVFWYEIYYLNSDSWKVFNVSPD